jgi:hypothetical protein
VGKLHERFGKKGNSWWPHQGYGINLDLRIYVYEDWELPGLKELQLGRAHNIDPQSCAKGQWGTQVGKSLNPAGFLPALVYLLLETCNSMRNLVCFTRSSQLKLLCRALGIHFRQMVD